MINRELIRLKVVQLTYAYYQNGNRNIDAAEKELVFSLSKAYDMYNHLLQLIVAVTDEARKHYDVEAARAEREGTTPPSPKFANNRLALKLEENEMLAEFEERTKKNWNDERNILIGLYNTIVNSSIYTDYMNDEDDSFEADKEVWRKLYKTFVQHNDDLDSLFEEQSLYWNDDKEVVDTFVLKTIKKMERTDKKTSPLLPEYDDVEDREFARKLFRATIINADRYQRMMTETSKNWDFSRLAYMDIVLMQIAIAEIMTFPNIPISVTINEYVQLARRYSTPKSPRYVNGMIDAIARNLVEKGLVRKPLPPVPEKKKKKKKKTAAGDEAATLGETAPQETETVDAASQAETADDEIVVEQDEPQDEPQDEAPQTEDSKSNDAEQE